jgi:hypothetical protein
LLIAPLLNKHKNFHPLVVLCALANFTRHVDKIAIVQHPDERLNPSDNVFVIELDDHNRIAFLALLIANGDHIAIGVCPNCQVTFHRRAPF